MFEGEKKWTPGAANEDSDQELDEIGKPKVSPEEPSLPLPKPEPSEMEEWIDGEPPIEGR